MFKDRIDAGAKLATKLMDLYNHDDMLVLGISAGGMITAHEVARQLNAPCDFLTVRKLRVPDHHTEPMGAIAVGGETAFNWGVIEHFNVAKSVVTEIEVQEKQALQEEEQLYRGTNAMPLELRGRTILLVDDGMGTGVTMRAAIDAMHAQSASDIIVVAPVAAPQVALMFQGIANRTVCYATPSPFQSVAHWYENFDKPSDETIRDLIRSGSMLGV